MNTVAYLHKFHLPDDVEPHRGHVSMSPDHGWGVRGENFDPGAVIETYPLMIAGPPTLDMPEGMKEPYRCAVCDVPVLSYEPEYCCDGRDCGCLGMPIEPCICSEACWTAFFAPRSKPQFEPNV